MSDQGVVELVGLALFRGIAVFLAFVAFWSLRRTDDVLLKARIYMNRHRVIRALLYLGLGMAVALGQAVLDLALSTRGEHLPVEVTNVMLLASGVLIVIGFYNVYALAKAPTAPGGEGA